MFLIKHWISKGINYEDQSYGSVTMPEWPYALKSRDLDSVIGKKYLQNNLPKISELPEHSNLPSNDHSNRQRNIKKKFKSSVQLQLRNSFNNNFLTYVIYSRVTVICDVCVFLLNLKLTDLRFVSLYHYTAFFLPL